MNDKHAEGLSANFVRGLRAVLRSSLTQAWKQGLIEQNVASRTNAPKIEHKDPEFLTPGEAQRLLQAAKGEFLEPLIAFTLATGVRIGEVSGLRWSDVDFNRETVSIAKQLQRVGGKLILKDVKSKSSRRTLHLSGIALNALQQQRASTLLDAHENPLGLVFLNHEGRPLDPKYVDDHVKRIMRTAGVRVMSFHKLRHTAATLMVAAGVELHQVKQQLGHSQISLTANLYAHGVNEAQRKAANKLDAVLRRGSLED
jgi:integrase